MINGKIDNNKPIKSSKRSGSNHGFGLSNVKKAIKKYNGNYSIGAENGQFCINILIPIPDAKRVLKNYV